MTSRYAFLVDTYRTERVKTLGVWSQVADADLRWRAEPRARSPLEHMVHQCVSEDGWMTKMLGVVTGHAVLPADETRLAFISHYADVSGARLAALEQQSDGWFEAETSFFEVTRSRAWVLTRRIAHSAHHRGQMTAFIRASGQALYSTYGPTADTGGLPKNGAAVIYRYDTIDDLIEGERAGARSKPLPGPGVLPATERPD